MSPSLPVRPLRTGRPGRRRWIGWILVLAILVAGGLYVRLRLPLLPIPTPRDLGRLDSQVRSHLGRLAGKVADSPRDPALRAEMGLAFAVNGLWSEARQSFLDALRLGDPRPLPAMYAAVALQELGDNDAAILELHEVVRQFPDFAPAWHRLGRAYLADGSVTNATDAFTTVSRLAPGSWHGWAGLGEAQLRAGRFDQAVASLEQARHLDWTARSVRHLLSQAYRAVGRSDEADAEAAAGSSQTLVPMPDDWSLAALDHMKLLADQFERADELLARNQPAEAVARLREALRFHPTNTAVIHGLARALNAAEQAETAWQLLAPAIEQRPAEVLLLLAAAETAAALERPDEAMALALRALALAPNSAEAHVAHANAFLAAGRDTEALGALTNASRLAPGDAGLLAQIGDVLWNNLQRPTNALESYRTACSRDPLNVGVLLRFASFEIDRGLLDEASNRIATLRLLHVDPAVLRELEDRLKQSPRPRQAVPE